MPLMLLWNQQQLVFFERAWSFVASCFSRLTLELHRILKSVPLSIGVVTSRTSHSFPSFPSAVSTSQLSNSPREKRHLAMCGAKLVTAPGFTHVTLIEIHF